MELNAIVPNVLAALILIVCLKNYSFEQLRTTNETFPIETVDRQASKKGAITDPGKVASQMLINAFHNDPHASEKDNQYWADRTLAQLSALYPWLRFIIIAGTEKPDLFRRIIYIDNCPVIDMYNRSLHISIYFTFETNRYESDTLDCYGNITDMFRSCAPNIDKLIQFIQQKCLESYGFIQVIRDDNRTYGMAWNLPENAFRIEEFRCQGPLAGNKTWRVIYAPYQKIDSAVSFVENLIKGNPGKYDLPYIGLHSAECNTTNAALILYSIILLLLSILLLGIYLLFKIFKKCKGSYGFYFKGSWIFGIKKQENELDNTLINIEQLIYTGQNSRVYFARYRLARYRFAETVYRKVVVKMPSRDAFQMCAIIEETRIAAQLRHPRVVEYIGFYRDAFGDVRIVSEFMGGGDLHAHLSRRENEMNVGHIFNFITQIAEGMEYLTSQRIVHRDLATRKCMLNLESTSIKIADFGLSRHFNLDTNYASSSPVRLPLRWLPIECFDKDGEPLLNCNFNEKTDVWAFGVVIWECFTRGAQPYGSEDFKDVVLRLMKCKNKNNDEESSADGWPLGIPQQCPQILYDQVMLKCWASEQMSRSAFSSILAKLDEVFDEIMTNNPDVLVQNVLFV